MKSKMKLYNEKVRDMNENEYESGFRTIVFYVFIFNFVLGLAGFLMIPWNLLGNLTFFFALYIYILFLNICLLAVVYWVKEDGEYNEDIMELKSRIYKLELKSEGKEATS